jgi:DNA polymerase-4
VKYYDFTVITRAHTIDTVTDSADCIYNAVKELIKTNKLTKAIRLLGVTVTNFEDENNQQLSLFTQDNNTSKLDSMLDEIREKYGYSAVKRATNLKNPFNNHANE